MVMVSTALASVPTPVDKAPPLTFPARPPYLNKMQQPRQPNRQPKSPTKPGAMIILRQTGKQWNFELPRITEEVDDRLEEGIEWLDSDLKRSASIFRHMIQDYPEHIDAYHHLALAQLKMGKKAEAFRIWERAVIMTLKFFPDHFSMAHDQLAWGFMENQPFLRLYHSYGWMLMNRGEMEEALQVFENMLNLNPHDNQGARAFLVSCYFALNQPEGVLSLCKEYPDDALEALVYGRGLAQFQLGRFKQAARAMDLAVKYFPLVAAEIVKKKHRKAKVDDQYVALGSQEQAVLYWQQQGRYWAETPGAIEFLKNRLFFQK